MSFIFVVLHPKVGKNYVDYRRVQKKIEQRVNIEAIDIAYTRYYPVCGGRSKMKYVILIFNAGTRDIDELVSKLKALLKEIKNRSSWLESYTIMKADVTYVSP